MKKLILAISALAALSLLAPSAGVAQWADPLPRNQIGMYTTATPTPDETINGEAAYNGAPGSGIVAYVVVTNPWNDPDDGDGGTGLPITQVGGFEFELVFPANIFLLGQTYPPSTTNFATPPVFYCGSAAPVSNGVATLITLTLGWFDGVPGEVFIKPVTSPPPSRPGNIAITDYNDEFHISNSHPSSGDFANPIFAFGADSVVPSEPASWGGVKSLYR